MSQPTSKEWRTVSVRMKDSDIAILNQKLHQSGFGTLGDLVRAFNNGLFTNSNLMDALADNLSVRIVDKLSTNQMARGANLSVKLVPASGLHEGSRTSLTP